MEGIFQKLSDLKFRLPSANDINMDQEPILRAMAHAHLLNIYMYIYLVTCIICLLLCRRERCFVTVFKRNVSGTGRMSERSKQGIMDECTDVHVHVICYQFKSINKSLLYLDYRSCFIS